MAGDTNYTVLDYADAQKVFKVYDDDTAFTPYVRATDGSGNALATETAVQSVVTALASQATATNQTTINTSVQSVVTALASQATEAKQDTINTSVQSVVTALSDNATATLQGTINTTLGSIVTALASQATATNQTTINTSIGTSNTALSAIQAAVETLDNAISGSEMQVDVVGITQPTTVSTGQETVAATATQFNSGTPKVPVGVITVKALAANTGTTYVGPSGVSTSTGHALDPGDSMVIEISNLNALYHIGTASDKLTWMCNT